jgi:hypothetical protein
MRLHAFLCSREQTLLSAEILGTLLPSIPSNTVLNRYGPSLKRALIHPVTEVKEIVLKEVYSLLRVFNFYNCNPFLYL